VWVAAICDYEIMRFSAAYLASVKFVFDSILFISYSHNDGLCYGGPIKHNIILANYKHYKV